MFENLAHDFKSLGHCRDVIVEYLLPLVIQKIVGNRMVRCKTFEEEKKTK